MPNYVMSSKDSEETRGNDLGKKSRLTWQSTGLGCYIIFSQTNSYRFKSIGKRTWIELYCAAKRPTSYKNELSN